MMGPRNYRKRAPYRFQSPTKEKRTSSQSSGSDRGSVGSGRSLEVKRSVVATIANRKSLLVHKFEELGNNEGKSLTIREWMLIIIEVLLSFASWVIKERNNNTEELVRVGMTSRQYSIYMLYWQGWASFGVWFTGLLADSYIGHYKFALFSVALHFGVVSIIYMEYTLKGNQRGSPYAPLVWNITTISTIVLKSTDFTRFVFGLEGMGNRNKSAIMLYIFLTTWSSSRCATGGPIRNLTAGYVEYPDHLKVSFITAGICLYMFLYFLRPEPKTKENWGVGIKVMRCIILACYLKCKHVGKQQNKSFLEFPEGKCDRTTIGKTKQLLFLYGVMLPTIGFCYFAITDLSLTFDDFLDNVNYLSSSKLFGILELLRILCLTTAVVTYVVVLPLLRYIHFMRSANRIYLFGYFFSVVTVFYSSFAFDSIEVLSYSSTSGFLRIFNTANKIVTFQTQNGEIFSALHQVNSNQATMVSYALEEDSLFLTTVRYENTSTNFSIFVSVVPGAATGYVVLEPPDMVRIPGKLPLKEGPPGTNHAIDPRFYLFNSAQTLFETWFTVTQPGKRGILKSYHLLPGKVAVFQLPEGVYDFSINEVDVTTTKKVRNGGIYGIIAFSNSTTRSIIIDEVKHGNSASGTILVPWGVFFGISFTCGYVGLRTTIYAAAPHGLMGMSFCYIDVLENVTAWVVYIGYHTWHAFFSASSFFIYSFFVTFIFFVNIYLFLKYKHICEF